MRCWINWRRRWTPEWTQLHAEDYLYVAAPPFIVDGVSLKLLLCWYRFHRRAEEREKSMYPRRTVVMDAAARHYPLLRRRCKTQRNPVSARNLFLLIITVKVEGGYEEEEETLAQV